MAFSLRILLTVLFSALYPFADAREINFASKKINMTGCYLHGIHPLVIDGTKQPSGDIYSPGFNERGYPNLAFCDYTVKASPGYVVKLTFKAMKIEPSEYCRNDQVYVLDGSDTSAQAIGTYCGLAPPQNIIYSSKNAIHLSFRSDKMITKQGFHAHYEVVLPTEKCPKGQHLCRNNRCYKQIEKCNSKDDCGDGTDEELCERSTGGSECGHGSILPIEAAMFGRDRIVGGIVARKGSWPWQADLQVVRFYPSGHECGGTLINSEWVMTAAHCLTNYARAEEWRVHLGRHNRFIKDDYEQIRRVRRLVLYPGHTGEEIFGKPVQIRHDIALMQLNAPVKITEYVRPACLPPAGYQVSPGTQCIASGWGVTRGTGDSDVLKQADLVVQSEKNCPVLDNITMICVQSERGLQDVCHGDSGGPLACKIGSKYHVMGITSFGKKSNMISGLCAVGNAGTIFNKVSAKVDWINEMVKKFS